MFDCAADVIGYHDDEVTLPQSERDLMRERRNANRNRIDSGLVKGEKPTCNEYCSQGSYSMKTMTLDSGKDYDIDDGIYFDKARLVGPRGGEMSSLEARQMVRDALDDGSFKTPPILHTNCVRVQYEAGYQVDVAVYRCVTTKIGQQEAVHYELASSDWKRSDARDITAWFNDENQKQSPDQENGRQLRRVTRLIKKFAKSRPSWKPQTLSGFAITTLVVECYVQSSTREDIALYYTMKAIRDRLNNNLSIAHPVTPSEHITSSDDPKARFLRDKLTDAIRWLDPLYTQDCTQPQARKCWDDVFNTTYFSDQESEKEVVKSLQQESVLTAGILRTLSVKSEPSVNKAGGGRYA